MLHTRAEPYTGISTPFYHMILSNTYFSVRVRHKLCFLPILSTISGLIFSCSLYKRMPAKNRLSLTCLLFITSCEGWIVYVFFSKHSVHPQLEFRKLDYNANILVKHEARGEMRCGH